MENENFNKNNLQQQQNKNNNSRRVSEYSTLDIQHRRGLPRVQVEIVSRSIHIGASPIPAKSENIQFLENIKFDDEF